MIYAICICLFVLFAMLGMYSIGYFFTLLFKKPRRDYQSVIVLPMNGDGKENMRRIEYAYERIHLFGEDANVKIIAIEQDDSDIVEAKEIFERYDSVYFTHLEDLPQVMSCLRGS